ncbi:TetR family transcriptional regulator C-terminal domain-containing protein [Patulibacter sp. NPDC049589]|uniref:LmrA/YxaF family transcription factor n=1 Tax=Patulibacter sp. NPDC049589 TaxID=3154731 RepID=UPI0034471894
MRSKSATSGRPERQKPGRSGAEAVGFGALRVRTAIDHCLAVSSSPGEAVERYFALAGEVLAASDWTEGCPVGTVALETSAVPGPVAEACGTAFAGWEAAWSAAFADAGVSPARAAELATIVVANVEGALLLGRVARSPDPMRLAGRAARALVDAEIHG